MTALIATCNLSPHSQDRLTLGRVRFDAGGGVFTFGKIIFMLSKIAVGSVVAMVACSVSALNIWINEFHYDNAGTDAGEFIEIAGSAGIDLSGAELLLYNGNGGAVYGTISLSGSIPDQMNGFGALTFSAPGLQNGSPDGIALVANSSVIQFLSYEGTFAAVGGPADGMTSEDIGVDESSAPPVGWSLQLTGTGNQYSDFVWSGPATASPGALNADQVARNAGQVFGAPDGGSTSLLLATALLGLWRARRFA